VRADCPHCASGRESTGSTMWWLSSATVDGDSTRWSIRRRDAIEALAFLVAAVVCLVAAVWLPPMVFHTSQRLVSFRLTLLSLSGGAVLGLVLAASSLVRHLEMKT
jgi:hypothetical protein